AGHLRRQTLRGPPRHRLILLLVDVGPSRVELMGLASLRRSAAHLPTGGLRRCTEESRWKPGRPLQSAGRSWRHDLMRLRGHFTVQRSNSHTYRVLRPCRRCSAVDLEPDGLPAAVLIDVDTPARGEHGHQPKPPASLVVPATNATLLGKLMAPVVDLDADSILAKDDDQADPGRGRRGMRDRVGDQLADQQDDDLAQGVEPRTARARHDEPPGRPGPTGGTGTLGPRPRPWIACARHHMPRPCGRSP